MSTVEEAKALVCEICRNLYAQGAVSGTGGGMSIKVGDRIVMAPSGVQKERMEPADMFVLDAAGAVLEQPRERPPPYKPPKLSECSPLFMAVRGVRQSVPLWHSLAAQRAFQRAVHTPLPSSPAVHTPRWRPSAAPACRAGV